MALSQAEFGTKSVLCLVPKDGNESSSKCISLLEHATPMGETSCVEIIDSKITVYKFPEWLAHTALFDRDPPSAASVILMRSHLPTFLHLSPSRILCVYIYIYIYIC